MRFFSWQNASVVDQQISFPPAAGGRTLRNVSDDVEAFVAAHRAAPGPGGASTNARFPSIDEDDDEPLL